MSQKKAMPYVRLGKSGLKVSKIILGCMSYGTPEWEGWVLDEKESIEHIRYAYEHGINTFDTAESYSNGLSEKTLGKAIKQIGMERDKIVVMTKCYFGKLDVPDSVSWFLSPAQKDEQGYVNRHGLSRKYIFDSVDASLKRLGLDYIDVFQCHRFDNDTPIEETMHALDDIVKSGKVRYIGMSSCYAWQFHIMQNYAIANKLTPFISMQNHYNMLYREEEREMIPTLQHFGVGMIPWSPLARGMLTHPMDVKTTRTTTDAFMQYYAAGPATTAIVAKVEEIAKKNGLTMAEVAFAWVASKPEVTAPIVGTTSLKNLEALIGALEVKLSDEDIKALDEPYIARSVMGHM